MSKTFCQLEIAETSARFAADRAEARWKAAVQRVEGLQAKFGTYSSRKERDEDFESAFNELGSALCDLRNAHSKTRE